MMQVVEVMRKLGAYEIQEYNCHMFVLGRFVWSYNIKSKRWIVKTVKKSTTLHEYLEHLKDAASDCDYSAYFEACEWADFLLRGKYTRKYALKLKAS